MDCRICQKKTNKVLDLGSHPIANSLLENIHQPEMCYPLEFFWCEECQFGQVNDLPPETIFGADYPYYSSINTSYVEQCKEWAKGYIKKYDPQSVVEIGCNDGYMLRNFTHITHEGYEPSKGPADVAKKRGIHVIQDYFLGTDHFYADLIIANNVLAHTPHLHKMVESIEKSLSEKGQVVVEFPDANRLIDHCLYDTIYHEHYSYFSAAAIEKLFKAHGLYMVSYDFIVSHGGSIRAYFSRSKPEVPLVFTNNRNIEYLCHKLFWAKMNELQRIVELKPIARKMAFFGAAAKGNTFINFLGIKNDLFEFCVDETPAKQGKYLPGSRIPIVNMKHLHEEKPDVLYILPWNFKDEIIKKTQFISEWGGQHIWKLT